MSGDGYEVFDDPYCYKNTFVLKNRANLRDARRLEAFELEMSSLRAEEPLPRGRFGPAHYRAIHRHLFGDVYTWAGQDRANGQGRERLLLSRTYRRANECSVLAAARGGVSRRPSGGCIRDCGDPGHCAEAWGLTPRPYIWARS